MKPIKFTSILTKIETLTPTVKNFTFSVPDEFEFQAGQFVSTILPDGEKTIRRSYSIASSPLIKKQIELCIKKVDDGKATEFFFKLKCDEEIQILGPMGHFTVKNREEDIIFISTGTGVAPFRSMAKELLNTGYDKQMIMLNGYRYEDEALFIDEFKELEKDYNNFRSHVTISRPKNEDYSGDKGRIPTLIEKYVPKSFNGHFYICGLNAMIQDVEKLLLDMGFNKGQIIYERYD